MPDYLVVLESASARSSRVPSSVTTMTSHATTVAMLAWQELEKHEFV